MVFNQLTLPFGNAAQQIQQLANDARGLLPPKDEMNDFRQGAANVLGELRYSDVPKIRATIGTVDELVSGPVPTMIEGVTRLVTGPVPIMIESVTRLATFLQYFTMVCIVIAVVGVVYMIIRTINLSSHPTNGPNHRK